MGIYWVYAVLKGSNMGVTQLGAPIPRPQHFSHETNTTEGGVITKEVATPMAGHATTSVAQGWVLEKMWVSYG